MLRFVFVSVHEGAYIRKWIPRLAKYPKEFIYERQLLRSRLWRSPDHWELAHE